MSDRLLLVAGLGLVAATYGLVRLAYGLFLPDVQHDLGFCADVGGAVSSGASVVYCVGAVAGSVLAARAARWLVVAATLTAGVGALVMASSPTTAVFGTAAVVASAGAGLASPAMVQLVTDRIPADRRGRAQAVVNSGTGPGLVAAGVLALVLLPEWRTAWAVAGVLTLAVGAVLFLAAGRPERGGTPALPGRSWFVAQTVPVVVALLFGAGSAVVWTYGRSTLVDAGVPTTATVVAWIALGVGGSTVAATARWTSAMSPRRQWVLTTTVAAGAVLALGLLPGSVAVALAACALFGWGYTAATGALIAWTAAIDPEQVAAGTSVLFVVLVAGQAVGAAVAGVLVGTVGTTTTSVAAAALVAVSSGLSLRTGDLRTTVATR
ncbi:MFS transporter [Curtobacterium sp. ER1/6]|uniref:MFS transporter n=1 Tax=Curtobacterium sp. ER1/6 TaxID=1891920 RepID=UPI000A96561F|nr:MFS transporter [Curtobacterium sp. ER1/6]